jgi:hypothetical protein
MPSIPDTPRRGDDILAWAQGVTSYLRSLRVRGTGVRQGPNGVTVARVASSPPPATTPISRVRRGFELVATSQPGTPPLPRVRVVKSEIMLIEPTGFSEMDDPPLLLTPKAGDNIVWAEMTLDGGAITEIAIDHGAEMPENDEETIFLKIGEYNYTSPALTVFNTRYGPIEGTLCPVWFSSPIEFVFTITSEGGS